MNELNAQFTISTRIGVAPLTVSFTNISSGPYTSVEWNFGDGSSSIEINPTHQYINAGTYYPVLKVFGTDGSTSEYRATITALQEEGEDDTVQQTLYTFKRFDPGQVQVRSTTVSGSTFETLYPFSGSNDLNPVSGSGIFELALSAVPFSVVSTRQQLIYSGDALDGAEFTAFANEGAGGSGLTGYLYIAWGGPSGQTTLDRWDSSEAKPIFTFKIVSADTSTPSLTIDRVTPLWRTQDSSGFTNAIAVVERSTNETYSSTDYRYLNLYGSVDSYQNFEISGWTNIDNTYNGVIQYFGLEDGTGQTVSIAGSNYSGYDASEKYTPGTIRLDLPNIMWHKSISSGITLTDLDGPTKIDESTSLRYRDLKDGNDNTVGKVLYDKKSILITDVELNAALTPTSNRNWTLPKPSLSLAGSGGDYDDGVKYYVTYANRDLANARCGLGTGYGTNYQSVAGVAFLPMHCRYIQSIEPGTGETRMIQIQADDSPWIAQEYYAGTGFPQNHIAIIIGTGTTASTVADDASWRYSACTSQSSLSNGFIIPNYSAMSASTYDSWMAGNTFERYGVDNEVFPYGSQEVGFGYLSGSFESTIYKVAATCVAKNNEFNSTQNDSHTGDDVYITEVGLYNENNDLLMIGKLSTPIKKNNEKYVTIKMEIDL